MAIYISLWLTPFPDYHKSITLMRKIKLNVPEGIKHLSDWDGFFTSIPLDQHFILNKRICGCGATEAFLRTDKKVILASPRKHLLYNKYSQHLNDNFHLFRFTGDKANYFNGNEGKNELDLYVSNLLEYVVNGGTKILTTYDSLDRIYESLSCPQDWIVVVDEFQVQFYDSHYKATTELQFAEVLKGFKSVIYLSATPFLSKYLMMEDTYRNLPMYELQWPSSMIEVPNVELVKTRKSVLDLASDIIGKYREGNGRTKLVDGETFTSREAVFYINNVGEIVKIIKKNGLDTSEVTIICSSTSENKKKIAKLGKGYEISEVPGKNEELKMFTFCTSTVYVGADFYSDNAYTYIFSNPNIGCMTLDVSVDLQQIIGRQRLESNPFRNSATLYYNTKLSMQTEEDLELAIREKNEKTKRKIENYDSAPHKSEELEVLEKDIKSGGHSSHYCCILKNNDGKIKVVNNKFLEIAERRSWEVSHRIYNGDFSMYQTIKEGANVKRSLEEDDSDLQTLFKAWTMDGNFKRKAQLYCLMMNEIPDILEKCSFIEKKFHEYYNTLGEDGLAYFEWQESKIKTALLPQTLPLLPKNEIHKKLSAILEESKEYSKSWVKEQLRRIYGELGIKALPSASDLASYMTVRESSYRENGRKIASFKIISHLRKNVSLFKAIYNVKDSATYDIDRILDMIKNDSYYQLKSKIEDVRRNLDMKDMYKKKLPVLCCNGIFSERNSNRLQQYSSFTILDFDHIEESKMSEFGEWIKAFPCVYASFISPSGLGWKVVVVHDNFEPSRHEDMYQQLLELFGCKEADNSTKDIARGNYLCYDPSLWLNPSPVPFHYEPKTEKVESKRRTETIVKDKNGDDMVVYDDDWTSDFLNKLSQMVVSDESVIRMLRKAWTGDSLVRGRNNTALAYAGILCKSGVEKDMAKEFIEELIPDFDVTEIMDYAYQKNIFGCERRFYNGFKN